MTALTVNYTAPLGPYSTQYGAMTTAINQAFNAWMSHFDAPLGAVNINVSFAALGGNEVASAGPDKVVQVGTSGSKTLYMSGFGAEVATGAPLSVAARSGDLNIDTSWFKTEFANPAANTVEIQRVLQHEIGHMLGFIGFTTTSPTGPSQPATYTTAFDNYLSFAGTAEYFSGPNAIAAYGGAVRMDYPTAVHTYVPNKASIMSYLDQATTIQPLDTAVLRDTGLPILSAQEVAEHEVTRLYLGALGRAPDAAGLVANTRALLAGASLSSDAAGLVTSGEFTRLYGANQSDTDFVSAVYQNVLHRAADASGQTQYLRALGSGMSRGDVVMSFSESSENRSALETTPNQSYSETVEAQAERLYDAALGRTPDAIGYGNLTRAMLNGLTLQQAALGFVQSGEFASRYGAATSNGAFVDALYQNTLHRAADPGGRTQYLAALNSGMSRADLLVNFSEASEHVGNVIRQDTPAPGAFMTNSNAHLGSIPTVPSALFG